MGKFAQLHLHLKTSIRDAMNKPKDLIKRAKELDLHAVAVTDHGNMFGIVEFAAEAEKAGLKYIIGSEAYIDPRGIDARGSRDNRHVVLLAKNEVGYKNLITLMTMASVDGYYYDPRIDHELLEKHSEGLVVLSACLGGDVAREVKNHVKEEDLQTDWSGGYEAGLERALWYRGIFGDDFYLEIQDNGIEDQYLLNDQLIKMSKETGIKLVATNDAHYPTRGWYKHHDAYMALGSGTNIHSDKRKKYTSDEFYVKGYDDMVATGNIPIEAIENTVEIADKCDFKLGFGEYKIPWFPDVPAPYADTMDGHYAFLRDLAMEGLPKRFKDWDERKDEVYIPRLDYELGVIKDMGFVDYFLIVWDFVKYAIDQGFYYGPGRGSGAGSILSYGLYITHIDPIEEGLIFERFLNPARISMPDEFNVPLDWKHSLEKLGERYCLAVYAQAC